MNMIWTTSVTLLNWPNAHFAQLAINIQENDRDKRDMDWCFYFEKSYSKEKYSKVNFAER